MVITTWLCMVRLMHEDDYSDGWPSLKQRCWHNGRDWLHDSSFHWYAESS